jgi:hypothetical protein
MIESARGENSIDSKESVIIFPSDIGTDEHGITVPSGVIVIPL